jgi:capsid protein
MSITENIKTTLAAAKWTRSKNKVNKAVQVFGKHGMAFSLADALDDTNKTGIIGNTRLLTKKENRNLVKAADVMTRNNAAFFTNKNRQTFDNTTALNVAYHQPLNLSDYAVVQEKSFKQVKESMHLRAPVQFLKRTLYDARLQAIPNRRILGITAEEAQEWSALTESLWRSEKHSKDWDESKQNDYSQLADMAFYHYKAIGEFFAVRRPFFDDENRLTNLSIQLFSPFQIQSPFFATWATISYRNQSNNVVIVNAQNYLSELPDGNYIESGIEYNKQNQEIAIYIAPVTFSDPWMRVEIFSKSGFQQVLHGFIQTEPGQKRGIAPAALSWHEYCNIKDLTIFELQSARLNATISGTVTADSNAQPNGKTPMADLGDKPPGWSDESPTAEALDPLQPTSYEVREVDGGGYIVQNFTPGYKYTEHETKRPNTNVPLFIEKNLEYAYPADFGLSVTLVNQRLEGSYNASKGKIDLSWKNGIEFDLKQFTSDYHRPNYAAWLAGKVATGEIPAPGWENFRKRNAWSGVNIITPPKPSMNPKQEAEAANLRTGAGHSNHELEAQNLTGTSFNENAERLANENEKLVISLEPLAEAEAGLEETENQEAERNA